MVQAAAQQEIQPDRRRYQRTKVALFGRCLLGNHLEIPCQAIDISPADAGIIAGHSPQMDEHVIIYLDHIGRIEGNVVRLFDGGFAVLIDATARKRDKLTAQIEWIKAHNDFHLEDAREHARIEPKNSNTELRLPDGRSYPVEIMDISLSGAAIKISVKPGIGTRVSLAGMQGIVTRHFPEGIAIEFASIDQ